MGNESLVWAIVFAVLLAASRAQEQEEGEVMSPEEPPVDFFVSLQGHDG